MTFNANTGDLEISEVIQIPLLNKPNNGLLFRDGGGSFSRWRWVVEIDKITASLELNETDANKSTLTIDWRVSMHSYPDDTEGLFPTPQENDFPNDSEGDAYSWNIWNRIREENDNAPSIHTFHFLLRHLYSDGTAHQTLPNHAIFWVDWVPAQLHHNNRGAAWPTRLHGGTASWFRWVETGNYSGLGAVGIDYVIEPESESKTHTLELINEHFEHPPESHPPPEEGFIYSPFDFPAGFFRNYTPFNRKRVIQEAQIEAELYEQLLAQIRHDELTRLSEPPWHGQEFDDWVTGQLMDVWNEAIAPSILFDMGEHTLQGGIAATLGIAQGLSWVSTQAGEAWNRAWVDGLNHNEYMELIDLRVQDALKDGELSAGELATMINAEIYSMLASPDFGKYAFWTAMGVGVATRAKGVTEWILSQRSKFGIGIGAASAVTKGYAWIQQQNVSTNAGEAYTTLAKGAQAGYNAYLTARTQANITQRKALDEGIEEGIQLSFDELKAWSQFFQSNQLDSTEAGTLFMRGKDALGSIVLRRRRNASTS